MNLETTSFETVEKALFRIRSRETRKKKLLTVLFISLFLSFPLELKAWWVIIPGSLLILFIVLDNINTRKDCMLIKTFLPPHEDYKLSVFIDFVTNLYG